MGTIGRYKGANVYTIHRRIEENRVPGYPHPKKQLRRLRRNRIAAESRKRNRRQ